MEIESTTLESAEAAEPSSSSEISRLGKCEVCMGMNAKYTCPKCEIKFCCLRCSAIHKRELECDGNRKRSKFVPMAKFTNMDLSQDYRLLEEINRAMERTKKQYGKLISNANRPGLPNHLFKLKAAAHKNKITLKFLPQHFIRHKENSTRLNYKTNEIFWRIDWTFVNANNLILVDNKVSEMERVGQTLQKYFVKQDNEVLQEQLQYYHALGLSGVRVLLRAERKPGTKYYEVDIDKSLRENLRKKVIIEYPNMIVVNKEHCSSLDIIDSDDEDEKMDVDVKVKSGASVIDKIVKSAESEENIYTSLKNLLFISEHEDDE